MIPKNLTPRVLAALLRFSAKTRIAPKIQKAIIQDLNKDLILPTLGLSPNVKVEFAVDTSDITLQIGPRDWQWDRDSGQLIGCGTCIGG